MDEAKIRQTIETMFEGFHKGDTTMMRSVMHKDIILQTAFTTKQGKDILKDDKGPQNFLNAVANRPTEQKWDERLLEFNIQIDGNMANAWVPYEFYLNEQFSHCGVNCFQLFRDSGEWKVIYLIDSRRRASCKD